MNRKFRNTPGTPDNLEYPGTPDNLEHPEIPGYPELHMLRGFFSSKIWWFGKILVISRRFTAKLK